MNWQGRIIETYQELLQAVSMVGSPEEAQLLLSAYRQVNSHADANIGWMIGDVDRDVGQRIIEWFGCAHPVFGASFPTPEEAFRKGLEIGEAMKAMKDGDMDAVHRLLLPRNPNPWFTGAFDSE